MTAINAAHPADAPAIKALLEAAYRGDSARQGWNHEADILTDERMPLAALHALFADANVDILVARDGVAVIGCVSVAAKGGGLGHLAMLCAAPQEQSAGLGGRLLVAAEDNARARGIARLEMTVIDKRLALIAWYRRRGYAPTGERRPYPTRQSPPIWFTVLEKQLAPV